MKRRSNRKALLAACALLAVTAAACDGDGTTTEQPATSPAVVDEESATTRPSFNPDNPLVGFESIGGIYLRLDSVEATDDDRVLATVSAQTVNVDSVAQGVSVTADTDTAGGEEEIEGGPCGDGSSPLLGTLKLDETGTLFERTVCFEGASPDQVSTLSVDTDDGDKALLFRPGEGPPD